MRKYTFSLMLLSLACYLNAQQLELVDELRGRIGIIYDIDVNQYGKRYYSIENAFDSLIINGQLIPLLPRNSIFPFGRNYSVSVDENLLISDVELLWSNHTLLTDSSRWIFSSLGADTTYMQDTFFINVANDWGSNLLLQEMAFSDNARINMKQWFSPFKCRYNTTDAQARNGKMYFCGVYGGIEGGVLLDDQFLDIGSGREQGLIGMMDENLEVQWLRDVGGSGYEIENKFAINGNNKILLTGASASSTVHFCEDSLVNQAVFHWGTDFLYLVQFDTLGNCINKKTIDYDYGGTIPTSISSLSDDSYVVSGTYTPSYIGFDSLYLYNPNNDKAGFLVKLSDNLEAQAVFQLEGSPGPKYILDMASTSDDYIVICGYAQADTLKIGNEVLVDDPEAFSFGFIALLDPTFNVISVVQVGGTCRKLISGQDGNIYLLVRYPGDSREELFKLSRINDIEAPVPLVDFVEIKIFPNPLSESEVLHYELESTNKVISHINVYDIYGRRLISKAINSRKGTLDLTAGILILEFHTNDNQRIRKKIIVR